MSQLSKILIANRGEIAVRIARTAREMGIRTVGIYAESDRNSGYFEFCDQAVPLTGKTIGETYLNISQIIEIALKYQCDGIHPGYGFLSENPAFARECEEYGIVFIGPEAQVIEFIGNKLRAKEKVEKMGIPVINGVTGHIDELLKKADELQFPVLIKAAAGGGGKGMRIAQNKDEFGHQLESAAREALTYFGDDSLYIEHYLEEVRHIEVQLIGDQFGKVIHLYHRECSLQRRHQKIIEEAPAISIERSTSERLLKAAVKIGEEIGYSNAGTIEFLVEGSGDFYFLEMNARIQVEHPVTEMITGIDIVEWQINVASGQPIELKQSDIKVRGHAIESRIYAEDPAQGYAPSPGKIQYFNTPTDASTRVDTWVRSGTMILPDYDSMIAKVISHKPQRTQALSSHIKALSELNIVGIKTNVPFLMEILNHPKVEANQVSTRFVEKQMDELIASLGVRDSYLEDAIALAVLVLLRPRKNSGSVWEELGHWRNLKMVDLNIDDKIYRVAYQQHRNQLIISLDNRTNQYQVHTIDDHRIVLEASGKSVDIAYARDGDITWLDIIGHQFTVSERPVKQRLKMQDQTDSAGLNAHVVSPIPGTVSKVFVKPDQKVSREDNLFIIEAMKMDNYVQSDREGTVHAVNVNVGDLISSNQILLEFKK